MKKTLLITGASAGFGKACAEKFAEAGWQLILLARRQARLEALQSQLSSLAPIHLIPCDIRDYDTIKQSLENLPEQFSNIDVCVNNAGLGLGLEPAHQTDITDWNKMVDTNIKGLMYCTRLVLPQMVERNKGHIINIGSIAGSIPYPGANTYGATKAFVKMFSQNLRSDLLGTAIRISNIEPGLAETEFSQVRFKGDTAKAKDVYHGTKPITASDIADMIFWVANTPQHININAVEVMPTCQAWAGTAIHRDDE